MIRYFFCALLGMPCIVTVYGQHNGSASGTTDVQRPAANINLSIPLFQQDNPFSLPRKAVLAGRMNEKIIYRGTVKDHRLNGVWQSWYLNGNRLDSGKLLNGVPDGEWKVWDSAGNLLAIRHYDEHKFHRIKDEMRIDHPRNSFFPLTQLYKRDRQSAKWRLQAGYSFPFTSERSPEPSLQQLVEKNISNTSSYQPVFNECLHHGVFNNYFSNGMLKDSGYYKDGLKEGIWIHRNSLAGSWFTGTYKNGMRQYEWKQYNASGRLILLIFYNKMGDEERRKQIGDRGIDKN
jgi:antitoxin component YwqK of YwqJK toxin-antitoxin module